jgi:serine/threonine-protein kinase LegK1
MGANMPKIMRIDLKKIGDNEKLRKQLVDFFAAQAKLNVVTWQSGIEYTLNDGSKFIFSHNVFVRRRKEGKEGPRYEVISKKPPIGSGGFGNIHKIRGTVALEENEYKFKKEGNTGKRRAVKIQFHSYRNPQENVLTEYELSKQADHLGVKQPTIDRDENTSFTIMDLLPGKELFEIINEDRSGKRPLTLKERVELTNALLMALKEQVIDKGIIHCDIKGENMLVDLGPPIVVNIIDYGLSQQADSLDERYQGTPQYQAPETRFNGKVSSKSDIFSLGVVIAELWGAPRTNDSYYSSDILYGLFSRIDGITSDNRTKICDCLMAMLAQSESNRLTIEQAIKQFSRLTPVQSPVNPVSNVSPTQDTNKTYSNDSFTSEEEPTQDTNKTYSNDSFASEEEPTQDTDDKTSFADFAKMCYDYEVKEEPAQNSSDEEEKVQRTVSLPIQNTYPDRDEEKPVQRVRKLVNFAFFPLAERVVSLPAQNTNYDSDKEEPSDKEEEPVESVERTDSGPTFL